MFDGVTNENDSTALHKASQRDGNDQLSSTDLSEPYAKLLKQTQERRDYYESKGKTPFQGWSTGFEKLDSILSGISRNCLFLLGGAPGVGKTSLAIQIADAVSKQIPVLYLTFENRPVSLIEKLFCAEKGENISTLQTGRTSPKLMEELESFCHSRSQNNQNLNIMAGSDLPKKEPIEEVEKEMSNLMKESLNSYGRPKACLIVDYLQLWAKRTAANGLTTRARIETMANNLYDLAQEENIAVIAISSLNRMSGYGSQAGQYDKTGDASGPLASLASLKESGDLEYTADSVMILSEERKLTGQEKPKQIRLDVLKNRYGSRGGVTLNFWPAQSRWAEGPLVNY